MKRKELRIVNIFLVVLVLFFGLLTVRLSINEDLVTALSSVLQRQTAGRGRQTTTTALTTCGNQQSLQLNSTLTAEPHLAMLERYQQLCGSYVTNTLMIFTTFPADPAADSTAVAKTLRALHQAGVRPIVIAEPYIGSQAMSYKDFLAGTYDQAMQAYFANLRTQGITDDMMGTWVPFPESNTPNWNNKDTEPRDFALCVNKYMGFLKHVFPQAKGSVLLSAVTYEPGDTEWENGDYLSLIPYLQEINKDYITSIGIQGFPWVSNAQATQRREIFRSAEFLQPELAIAAAQELRTRDIWFNTGSFAVKYTNDPAKQASVSPNDRQAILQGILAVADQVRHYQQNEYRVSVNLFSEDKSKATEATDWSYWRSDDDQRVLREFLAKAVKQGTPVSLFDQKK